MKKLLISTALISSVFALSSAAIAEIKISGSIEQTYKSVSHDASNATATAMKGGSALGQETNLKVSGSKDLENGLKTSGFINLEDSAIDQSDISIGNGTFTVTLGADTNQTIATTINPRVGDDPNTLASTGTASQIITDGLSSYSAHDVQHVGFTAKVGDGTVNLNYAPSGAGITNGDSTISDTGVTGAGAGSAVEISYSGTIMPGLKVLLGQQVTEAANGGNDATERTYQVAYSQGAFAVGYAHRTFDDKAVTTEVSKVTNVSASFAASKDLSISIERAEGERDGDNDEEEITTFGIGYNLGGFAITAQYAETKNFNTVAGDDSEAFQVRTVYAF